MNNEIYRKALDEARAEMAETLRMREKIEERLTHLKSTIDVLSALLQEPPKLDQDDSPEMLDSVGISEAIRQVLKDADVGLMPNQVKAKLSDAGFDLSKYANPSAVIHNTLKRLETQGEVVQVRDSSGVTAYTIRPSYAEEIGEAFGKGIAEAMTKAGADKGPKAPTLNQLKSETAPRAPRRHWLISPPPKP
jgi:hypothetical protein